MANASLICNPLRQLWSAYERQLEKRPVLTQMTTSALLWGTGDIIAQRLEYWEQQAQREQSRLAAMSGKGSKGKVVPGADPKSSEVNSSSTDSLEYDWKRAFMTAMFGSTFVGPVGHFWYIALDKWCSRIVPGGGPAFIATKVAIDTIVLGPFYVAAFFAWGCALIDQSGYKEFQRKMKVDFLPTLAAEMSFWPTIQALNFSFVPIQHQLLVVNSMTILDAIFMSWSRNQEDWLGKVKGWFTGEGEHQHQQQQQQQQLGKQGSKKGH